MSLVLGIETSQALCSAALARDGAIVAEDTRPLQRLHNEVVLECVDGVMRDVAPADLDAVGFGCGPGSFTGIRIAASVAQAIAYAADARIVPVSSSLLLAHCARKRAVEGALLTCIPSRRDCYYVAVYEGGGIEPTLPDVLWEGAEAWSALNELPRELTLVGHCPDWAIGQLPFEAEVASTGADVGVLATELLTSGGGLEPEAGVPVYVMGDSPWRPAAGG